MGGPGSGYAVGKSYCAGMESSIGANIHAGSGTSGWVGRALDMPSASHTVQAWSRALAQTSTPEVALADGIAEKRDWLFLVAKQIGSLSEQNISEHSALNEG